MNFIILRIIFRKYLHISKILLFACTLFIIKNFDLLYPLGNPRTKSPWPEDSRGFSEGLLSGYRISVYYIPIPEGHIWSIVSVLR